MEQAESGATQPQVMTERGWAQAPQLQQLAVPAQLARLNELLDHAERGMVSLLDARGVLEDRIQPALSKSQGGEVSLPSWAAGQEGPACSLSEALSVYCQRLEKLCDSMSAEEQLLRSIAARVQL